MSNDNKSLAYTKWNCKYHMVVALKYRRKVAYGKFRAEVGRILRELCERKERRGVWKFLGVSQILCKLRTGCKTAYYISGRQRLWPMPPCLQHNAGGSECQGRRCQSPFIEVPPQAARKPLTSGHSGVILACDPQNKLRAEHEWCSSPAVGQSISW